MDGGCKDGGLPVTMVVSQKEFVAALSDNRDVRIGHCTDLLEEMGMEIPFAHQYHHNTYRLFT